MRRDVVWQERGGELGVGGSALDGVALLAKRIVKNSSAVTDVSLCRDS